MTNNRFERDPGRSPFDWSIVPNPGVEYEWGAGLAIRFLGKENFSFANVAQTAAVKPGKYRLEAERLDAAMEMVRGTPGRCAFTGCGYGASALDRLRRR